MTCDVLLTRFWSRIPEMQVLHCCTVAPVVVVVVLVMMINIIIMMVVAAAVIMVVVAVMMMTTTRTTIMTACLYVCLVFRIHGSWIGVQGSGLRY